uniref:WAP domain-containing protein n=1 Tax=Sinocyclocheilus anshuiensis TaxID=1608454 RepID=A0A671L745_9TELE
MLCSRDGNCPNDEKCCSNGCGHQCMPPYKGIYIECVQKPILKMTYGHCPNDEKCCSNGCGHQCMAVSKVKPGVCPGRFLGVGLCKGLCVNDIDCPKDEKCCSTKCGRKCTPPYKGIRLVYVSNQMCADNSSHDDLYPARQKCCLTTCACSAPCQFSHLEKVLDCSLRFSFFCPCYT